LSLAALIPNIGAGIVLPFESSGVRYSEFVTHVPRSRLDQLLVVVDSLADTPERLQRMRSAMESMWMRITWQRPLLRRGQPKVLDAFELLLIELKQRKR
jgi:hypothetical protein